MFLFRHKDGDIDREEQETDERVRDLVHDGVLVDGRLRVRHPDWRHPRHCQQRPRQRPHLSEASRRCHGLHEQQQSGEKSSGKMTIDFAVLHHLTNLIAHRPIYIENFLSASSSFTFVLSR